MSAIGRFCCKSLKSRGYNFFRQKTSRAVIPINIASGLLPKSPVAGGSSC
jgi:hypothetical protein